MRIGLFEWLSLTLLYFIPAGLVWRTVHFGGKRVPGGAVVDSCHLANRLGWLSRVFSGTEASTQAK